jgi:ribosome-associated protein
MNNEEIEDPKEETLALLMILAETASKKKGFDIVAFELTEIASFTDYFLIVSAKNPRAGKAIAEEIKRVFRDTTDTPVLGIEGLEACSWILVDMPGVIVHVFEHTKRGFYNLEGLWQDAPRVELPVFESEKADLPELFFPG